MAKRDEEAQASQPEPAGPAENADRELDPEKLWAMLDGVQSERDQHKESADEYLNMLQRTRADFVNYKRRVEAEQDARAEAVRAETIRAFLPVVDDLERALHHVPADAAETSWVEGFRLIERNLATLFERLGVRRLGTEGEEFDPNLHEAVAYEEHATHPEGHVSAVIRPGYQLGERVIRPAQVAVARAAALRQSEPEDAGWSGHRTRRGHPNGGVDPADLHAPRNIERA